MNDSPVRTFYQVGGISLIVGACLQVLVNAVIFPMIPEQASFAQVASSPAFAWRQAISTAAAACLCFGSVGLYFRHVSRTGPLTAIAFALAFLGSSLLLAHEWTQVFLVRDLAQFNPAVLEDLEDQEGLSLFDLGALIAITTFSLGWLAFAVSILWAKVFPALAPAILIAGFFLTPILGGVLPSPWGVIIGNLILASGWMLLGWKLLKVPPDSADARQVVETGD